MTTPLDRTRRLLALVVTAVLGTMCAFPAAPGTASTAPAATSSDSSHRSVADVGRAAREVAYDLLGDRPFQAVVMSGQRAVMTASSPGTSPFTDVPIASISKLVTAMTLMRLVETGRIDTITTLGEVLPQAIVPQPWREVTIDQLLTHTSGFAADRDRWFNDTYSSCFDAFLRITRRDAPAAASYEYSNTNFCALSLAIGAVSGPSYDDAVYRLLFRPLGIGRKTMDADYSNLSGAGGWRMSALDVGRIVAALDPAAEMSPLSATTRSQMVERTSYNYGRGVWIFDEGAYGHSGSLYRARSIAVRLPSGRVVVILTQATFPESGLDLLPIARQIDAAFEEPCVDGRCSFPGLEPFDSMPTGILGINLLQPD